jgi:uncharacterized protein (TIGR02271 family)
MKHMIVAVFENGSNAQAALNSLLAAGFSREDARLSESDTAAQTGTLTASPPTTQADDTHSIAHNVKHFFSDFFGGEHHEHAERAELYSNAVSRGHFVLTVRADDDATVERASDIIEGHEPLDIDDRSSEWGSTFRPAQDGMRSDSRQSQASAQGFQSASGDALLQGTQARQGALLQGSEQRGPDMSTAIPVVQEALKVGKREVQRGGVRVYSRLVETPVNESIGLREEHVNVERHAVDRPVDIGDTEAFRERSYEMREMAEEAVVEKSARIVEEVVIGKAVSQHQEQISDTVRHTEVEIENLGPADALGDEAYYRQHWLSNLSQSGGAFNDYDPAYRYGSSMASRDQYRGRPWDEVEPTLRTGWEANNPGSAWDKMKAAVRHGWERIAS